MWARTIPLCVPKIKVKEGEEKEEELEKYSHLLNWYIKRDKIHPLPLVGNSIKHNGSVAVRHQ